MKSKRYYAIDILRVLLAFGVVLCHFWSPESETGLNSIILAWRHNAASAFFLLSFFLIGTRFLTNDQVYLKKRLKRLLIPFIAWGMIAWLIYAATHLSEKSVSELFMALFWQMLTGHGDAINPPLWFLAVLIWLTGIYSLLFKVLKKHQAVTVICILAAACLILQAAGINAQLFGSLPFETKYPLGRTVEMIPYATSGILLAAASGKHKVTVPVVVTSTACLVCYLLFPEFLLFKGFGYSGIMKLAASASLILIALYFDSFSIPDRWKPFIRIISAHTLGIYCMHYDLGYLISKPNLIGNSFLLCIVIYIACYLTAMIMAKVPQLKQLVD